jgi:hypothetical protein
MMLAAVDPPDVRQPRDRNRSATMTDSSPQPVLTRPRDLAIGDQVDRAVQPDTPWDRALVKITDIVRRRTPTGLAYIVHLDRDGIRTDDGRTVPVRPSSFIIYPSASVRAVLAPRPPEFGLTNAQLRAYTLIRDGGIVVDVAGRGCLDSRPVIAAATLRALGDRVAIHPDRTVTATDANRP